MNRLQDKYQNEVVPAMMKEFNYKSVMEVPAIAVSYTHLTLPTIA